MTLMEVRELKEGEHQLWDELVGASPQGTIFHNYFWLETASNLTNRDLKIYGCFRGDRLIGGCSLYLGRYKFVSFASSTVEMTPCGGLVLEQASSSKIREQETIHNEIIYAILKVLDVSGLPYIKLTNSPGLIDIRPFTWSGWESKVLYTYCLDLNGDIDAKISKKARNIIRKAAKSRITVKMSRDINAFYDLFAMTFERQGLKPPVTKGFMEKTIKLIDTKDAGDMWIAETDSGVAAAAEIFIWDNKRAYRWSAASNPSYRDTGAPSFLLHEVFGHLKENGFKEVNLMAANTPNLTKFMSSFNPRLVPYYSVERKCLLAKLGEICYIGLRRHRI
jgi:hypothetical protein